MAGFRLTTAARADIVEIFTSSEQRFSEATRLRYESLLVAALRDAASGDLLGRRPRPELGDRVFSWHLAQSPNHAAGAPVRQPRHFLVCRQEEGIVVVIRVLHDAMDVSRHIDGQDPWK